MENPTMQPGDFLPVDDILGAYELKTSERLMIKMAVSSPEPTQNNAFDPGLSDALRSLRSASVEEARDNAFFMQGHLPPEQEH